MTHRSFLFYVFACLHILLILILSCLCHLFLQSVCVMQKMSYFFPVLCVCLDVCVVHTIRLAQLSPLLLSHPFITLWVGALTRASLLAFLAFTYPGSLPWTKSLQQVVSWPNNRQANRYGNNRQKVEPWDCAVVTKDMHRISHSSVCIHVNKRQNVEHSPRFCLHSDVCWTTFNRPYFKLDFLPCMHW